jgi:hypothetical protein
LLFLHPNGGLSTYNMFFDEVNHFAADTERDWALRIGSREHPELAAWITPRPLENVVTCQNCGGSGWARGESDEYACPECDGRGWQEQRSAPSEG